MGFFSDLKEDLSQAVNELMPEEEQIRTGEEQQEMQEEVQGQEFSFDEMPEKMEDEELPKEQEEVPLQEQNEVEEQSLPKEDTATESEADDPELEKILAEMLAGSPLEEKAEEKPAEVRKEENKGAGKSMEMGMTKEAVDETSVITAGMTITGDIATEGSIDVIGTVIGNLDVLGKLNITGHITGNSKAAEIYAESAKINGEVVSEGAVKVGASSVIIGNITATSAAIAGAVKGDIDVRGPVILDASAIVMGNIKSKSVQINNGAVIEGMCSQCYADVNPTSFFDDFKPEVRKSKAK